ncbi:hypothetical protein AFE_1423 [Acidithiobacillus ferrooxidans ATCC 23270]|uniref:Uncharacterized protein n=1 Tax=Acidithiobacillus ferrooxidans (strain ATCC 23270 / DSM 14882 / CIP 104768 / NCIMB 8455) TaxID=243159 RepID=B7J9M0_ACIF2|nr:hypothetical protein AFE_1423 [Acidithiobacillus ferrooxidans ATCC 23270]
MSITTLPLCGKPFPVYVLFGGEPTGFRLVGRESFLFRQKIGSLGDPVMPKLRVAHHRCGYGSRRFGERDGTERDLFMAIRCFVHGGHGILLNIRRWAIPKCHRESYRSNVTVS